MKLKPLKIENIMEENLIKLPVFTQETHKGKRIFINKDLEASSKKGEHAHCNFAKHELEQLLKQFDFIQGIDATLYAHGLSQREMKKEYEYDNINISTSLKLYINDLHIEKVSAFARYNILNELKKFVIINKYNSIVVNTATLSHTKEEILNVYASSLEKGYEGVIATHHNSFYIANSNSKNKVRINP